MLPKSHLQELFLEFAKEGIAAEEAMHGMLMSEFGGTDVCGAYATQNGAIATPAARLLLQGRDCYNYNLHSSNKSSNFALAVEKESFFMS